jgi:hypothetical protein
MDGFKMCPIQPQCNICGIKECITLGNRPLQGGISRRQKVSRARECKNKNIGVGMSGSVSMVSNNASKHGA